MSRNWFVSELYYPEETSTGYYITRIAEGLAGDFDVHVLCGQPTYSVRGTRAPSREVHNGVSIKRCAGTTLDKNVLLFKFLNMVTLTVSILFNALSRFRKGDTVVVVTRYSERKELVGMAQRARTVALEKYSMERALREYRKVLSSS